MPSSSLLYLALPIIMGLLLRYTRLSLGWATVIFVPLVGVVIWVGQFMPFDLGVIVQHFRPDLSLAEADVTARQNLGRAAARVLPGGGRRAGVAAAATARAFGRLFLVCRADCRRVSASCFGGFTVQFDAFRGWDATGKGGETFHAVSVCDHRLRSVLWFSRADCIRHDVEAIESRDRCPADRLRRDAAGGDGRDAGAGLRDDLAGRVELAQSRREYRVRPRHQPVLRGARTFPTSFAMAFGLMAFTTFVYDTLDVCTRLGRFIVQELTGLHNWAGRLLGSALTAGVPLFFVMRTMVNAKGEPIPVWRVFWPLFGASNQLLAALTLLGVTVWLWRTKRSPLVWLITGVPTVVMYIDEHLGAGADDAARSSIDAATGEFLRADRSGAVGGRCADRAGGADARRSCAGDSREQVAADGVQAGDGVVLAANRADHLNRLAAFERAGLGVELGAAFDGDHQRAVDVFLRGDDVADAQADQVGRGDVRFGQFDDHIHDRAVELVADCARCFPASPSSCRS